MKKIAGILLGAALCCLHAAVVIAGPNQERLYPKTSYAGVEALYAKYACPVQNKKLRGPDARSLSEWPPLLQTKIVEGAKQDINFAGKFVVVEWGCGTACQAGAMIDTSTGVVYAIPTSEYGKEYTGSSSLFIVNPPSKQPSENIRPDYAYPAYYEWNRNKFNLLYDTRSNQKK